MAPIAPVVASKEYRRAPFFTDDALMEGLQENVGIAVNPCIEPAKAPDQDAEPLEAPIIPPQSVLRMRIDRGDFPYSHIIFESYSNGIPEWGQWVAYIIANPQYCTILEKCGLYRMVERFNELILPKQNDALVRLVARWSTETHTFVTKWGEFTVTLEDVVQLLGLEPIGEVSYFADIEEANLIVDSLQMWFSDATKYVGFGGKSTSKTSFNQWQRYCFEEATTTGVCEGVAKKHKYHLAAFLLAFLSRFLAPGRAADCPRRCLFRLAALLSLGYRLPLAQFFLGNLYFQLDEIHSASERSGGRYDVGSFVHGSFLTAFLYERFRGFAPKVKEIAFSEDEVPIRIEKWHKALSEDKINLYIDNEEDFTFRAYCPPSQFWSFSFFESEAWLYDHPSSMTAGWLLGTKAATLSVVFPSFLPYLIDEGEGYVHYNPNRCWRQLGLDQTVPLNYFGEKVSQDQGNRMAWSFHTTRGLFTFCSEHDQLELPSWGREGSPSERWFLYWARQSQLFVGFVDDVSPTLAFPLINTVSDSVLRKQKSKEEGWRGSVSPFKKTVDEEAAKKTKASVKKKTAVPSPPPAIAKKAPLPPPPKKNFPPSPPTKTRTTRAAAKKRSRDEDLSNFVAAEEEAAHSKRRKALEKVKQAKKGKAQTSEEGTATFVSLNNHFMLY